MVILEVHLLRTHAAHFAPVSVSVSLSILVLLLVRAPTSTPASASASASSPSQAHNIWSLSNQTLPSLVVDNNGIEMLEQNIASESKLIS